MTNENKAGSFPIRLAVMNCNGKAKEVFEHFSNMTGSAGARSSQVSKLTTDILEVAVRFNTQAESNSFYKQLKDFLAKDIQNIGTNTKSEDFVLIRG